MSDSQRSDEVLECTRCEHRIREHAGRSQFVNCPHCGERVVPDIPRQRAPAFLTLALVIAAWSAAVLPQIGRAGSAEVTCIATLAAFSVIAIVHGKWKGSRRSVKLLEGSKRALGTMLVVSGLFALLSVYLRLAGESYVANQTLSSILGMQITLAEWQARTTLKAVTKWLLLGAAVLAIGATLFSRPGGFLRMARYRRSLSRLLSLVSFVIIAFGSFSIIAAASAAAPVRLMDEEVTESLRQTEAALDKLEEQARIVFGEQLAAAIVEAQQASPDSEEDSSDTDTLLADIDSAEAELARLRSTQLPDDDGGVPPAGGNLSDSLGRISAAYRNANPPAAELRPSALFRASYADLTPAQIAEAVTRPENSRLRPTAQQWTRPNFHQAIELIVDVVLERTGVSVPSVEAPRPMGAFFQKLVDAVTSKPANDRIKASITDLTVQLVRGETTPRAKVNEVARQAVQPRNTIKSYLRDRLAGVRQRIQMASPPPPPPRGDMCECERYINNRPTGQIVTVPCSMCIGGGR